METSAETILKTKNSNQETLESIIVHTNHVITKDGNSLPQGELDIYEKWSGPSNQAKLQTSSGIKHYFSLFKGAIGVMVSI